ncbi:MAG: DUF6328 family protein [Acidobacteriota bacterium]|nr:DUF6328 family protein [Acidobacteriota bacterium]
MTKLSDKIKTALDESRMLILGTQILLGFQYRAVFEKGFDALPRVSQYLKLVGLGVLLLAVALLMWPGAYHRIVREGNDSTDVHDFTSTVMDVALLPITVALGLDFYVLTGKLWGAAGGLVVGAIMGAIALFFWYGLGIISGRGRDRYPNQSRKAEEERKEDARMQKTPIHNKVEQVLTEARVVLPGAQALLGFQFATILLEAFDKLPLTSKYVHMVSLVLLGISVILLMTPAAYHRIVERGEETEHFHNVASSLLLAAMATLPLGICGDLFVVVLKVTESMLASIASAVLALIVFYGLWFGFTTYRKAQLKSR